MVIRGQYVFQRILLTPKSKFVWIHTHFIFDKLLTWIWWTQLDTYDLGVSLSLNRNTMLVISLCSSIIHFNGRFCFSMCMYCKICITERPYWWCAVLTWNTSSMISSTWLIPSSVRSTDIPKNPIPLAAGRLPATKWFDHPRSLSADNRLPGPSCPIKWLI